MSSTLSSKEGFMSQDKKVVLVIIMFSFASGTFKDNSAFVITVLSMITYAFIIYVEKNNESKIDDFEKRLKSIQERVEMIQLSKGLGR